MTKSDSTDELATRTREIARRIAGRTSQTIRYQGLELNSLSHEITLGGQAFSLTPTEYTLFEVLLTNQGKTISVERLMSMLEQSTQETTPQAIQVHIHSMGNKIGHNMDKQSGAPDTVWAKLLNMIAFSNPIRRSLRYRLLTVLLLSLLLLMGVTMLVTYRSTNHEMNEILNGQMVSSGRALFSLIVLELREGEEERLPALLDRYVRLRRGGGDWVGQKSTQDIYDSEFYFQLVNPAGTTVFASRQPPLLQSAEQTTGFFKANSDSSEWHMFGLQDNETHYTFYTGQSSDLRLELSRESTQNILFPFILGTPLIMFAIWIGTGIGLKPIAWMSNELDSREPDAIDTIDLDTKVTELHPLIHAMNRLFERVTNALENERRFSADASHELRTPLAGIKANVDAARFYTDRPELREIHRNIERGVDNATHITEDLLLLSKLESARVDEYFDNTVVDAILVLEEEIKKISDSDLPQHCCINFSKPFTSSFAIVMGSETLMRVLLRNILDNAVRYSGDSGDIHVELVVDDAVIIRISDNGPGIPVDQQNRVFQRFYRIDLDNVNGTGLGLALSRQIAEAMGGSVTIANRFPTGLLVTVTLPMHQAEQISVL